MTSCFRPIGEIACIAIEGADARRFAQAQFAGDVDALAPGQWQWNAWLGAKGPVRALMHLADVGQGTLFVVLRGGDAEATHAALTRFVLRMHVTATVFRRTAFAGGPVALGTASREPDGTIMLGYGTRSLRLVPIAATLDQEAQSEWRLQDIRQGWPTLPAGETGFLPPALGLEHLGAVAFRKGCYPGQEIAARLHFRGGHKYRLHHLRGRKLLSPGRVPDANGTAVWVLDAVTFRDGIEALTVMSEIDCININILNNNYDIVSIFNA